MKPSLVGLILLVCIALLLVTTIRLGMTSNEGFSSYGETNERGTFTMYYADWCPHCQNVKPLFKDFMGTGVVKVNGLPVKVKMVEEKQIQKGVDPDIKGYPSFLYSDSAGKVVEFNGPRNANGFMEFLKQEILS
jgi:thiol-disulfide isomerase/thioredoxin